MPTAADVKALKSCVWLRWEAHGRKFVLRRLIGHSPPVYTLRDLAVTERCRFGTLAEIVADMEYTIANGTLPPVTDPRW